MLVKCVTCGEAFDDAARTTICPHQLLMSDAHLRQKDLAYALMGKVVRFAHQPDGPDHRIVSCNYIGMVTLRDIVGEFAPSLFNPVKETT